MRWRDWLLRGLAAVGVIATFALARLAGGSWVEAAALANAAAGVVVEVPGTACVSPDELIRALARADARGGGHS